jgi:hypothetical protein
MSAGSSSDDIRSSATVTVTGQARTIGLAVRTERSCPMSPSAGSAPVRDCLEQRAEA